MMTTFTILTTGSPHHFSNSEQMAGLLKEAKFALVNTVEDADIVIFNTCKMKSQSDTAFFTRLEKMRTEYPHKSIVITGCIPQAEPSNPRLKKYCLLGTRQIHKIVQVVEEALNDNVLHLLETAEMPPLHLPRVRRNRVVGIVPLALDSQGVCSFCKIKSIRSTLQSYSVAEIKTEVEQALKDGVREIWLTSQDTFCYGFDLGTDIVALLKEVVEIPGNFMIRLDMGNPVHLLRMKEELPEVFKNPKMFKFLHLPLQTGHDAMLREMKQEYTVAEFMAIVHAFRDAVPEMTLMTDIVVGYPTETDEEYQATVDIMRKMMPDSVTFSRFWLRPGMKATKLDEMSEEIVNHRLKTMTDIFHNISKMQNERWMGWKGEMIIDERDSVEKQWIGRNYAYKSVIVEGDYKLGDVLKVQIVKTTSFDLRGEVEKE